MRNLEVWDTLDRYIFSCMESVAEERIGRIGDTRGEDRIDVPFQSQKSR